MESILRRYFETRGGLPRPARMSPGARLATAVVAALVACVVGVATRSTSSAEARPPTERTHRVSSGESLPELALRYYGDSKGWESIYMANRSVLVSRRRLEAGLLLVIPLQSNEGNP